jgi:peptidyl-tRNA hydrolase
MKKLYVITRSDLRPGAQLAQSCHAVAAFALAHPEAHRAWAGGEANIVCLSVAVEDELAALLEQARGRGLPTAPFYEPDLGGELTAIALAGAGAALVASLPLALRYKPSAARSSVELTL